MQRRSSGERRVGAAVAAAGLMVAAAACGQGPPAPQAQAPAAAGSTLHWTPCNGTDGPTGVQCATLDVPADPGHSGGPTIALALDRIPATGTRIGSLVVNPGGPGVSAVDSLPGIAGELTAGVRSHFDIVGYDPPGVGHSAPVACLSNAALGAYESLDPSPPGPGGFVAIVSEARSFAASCASSPSGPLLADVSTVDAARDMDLVRAALGDARLTYLGFSYGTLLGATYAGLYPNHVRAMVLDGAIDPAIAPLPALVAQGTAVDAQFAGFAAACRAEPSCPWKPGPDPTASFDAILARARAGGLSGRAGAAQVLYGAADGLYSTTLWPRLASALAEAEKGDGGGLTQLFDDYVELGADGRYSTVTESETAVNCVDATAPSLAQVQQAADQAAARGSIFTPLDVDGEATCAVWPVPASGGLPRAISAAGSPPIVVVGSTGDPITPYVWAQQLARQLGTGVLLTRVGDGHTAYGASACVRAVVQSYLVGLRPPAAGTRCPSS